MNLSSKLKEFFSLDYRSLAIMRIGMGVLIILDLIERSHSLVAHYTDAGVLPRSDLFTLDSTSRFFLSIHTAGGSAGFEIALFIIAGIFALMLIFGYRTRLATIISWFFLISLQARNPMILQGGDILFRAILFWMMFLPTGACWSMDRLLGRRTAMQKTSVISGGTFAYVLQIVVFYAASGLAKTGIAWHDGTAVYYALSIDQLTRPLGALMRNWYGFDRMMTIITRYFEIYGSLLFFIPVGTGMFRTLGILLFALMQVGFNLSFHLGYFGAICIVATLGLLPTYFWDRCIRPVQLFFKRKARTGLTIYYDRDCGFCTKMVSVLSRFLLLSDETKIIPAAENPTMTQLMKLHDSWVVSDSSGENQFGFRGLAIVVGYSPIFGWLRYVMLLPGIRDIGEYCYRHVAERRLTVCLPEKQPRDPKSARARMARYATSGVAIFFALYMLAWNVSNQINVSLIPQNMHWIAWTTRLDQVFDMFAPTPLTQDGWYTIPATLKDGQKINLFADGPMLTGRALVPVSFAKPANVADTYPDQRWQKYMMNIAEQDNSDYRLDYGKYLCRTWNSTHTGDETLETFQIYFTIKNTEAPGAPALPLDRQLLWDHHCY